MGMFWDIMKFGLPVLGGFSAFAYARHKGMTPIPQVGVAMAGWVAGYLVYKGASKVADGTESLPEATAVLPPGNSAPGRVPSLDEVKSAVASSGGTAGLEGLVPTPGIPGPPPAAGQGAPPSIAYSPEVRQRDGMPSQVTNVFPLRPGGNVGRSGGSRSGGFDPSAFGGM
jgi:hypothetical protein